MIIHGDCLEEMRKMEDNSISAIVTDPPYGLHFMGKDWDKFGKVENQNRYDKPNIKCSMRACEAGQYDNRRNDEFQTFLYQFGIEALRIVKPGGHILMFGAPRRYHRQVSGLEDAGWEIRDCLMWIFGSGFPKSHNHFGIEGFGTALKPAYEPIVLAMKPCEGTFKQNAEKWGQAGINIDGCRIAATDQDKLAKNWDRETISDMRGGNFKNSIASGLDNYKEAPKGRWPANVIFDEEAAKMLDEQSGESKTPSIMSRGKRQLKFGMKEQSNVPCHGDSGGASRFFYCAKTSSRERNEGLEGMPEIIGKRTQDGGDDTRGRPIPVNKNHHPTVKPLKLMRYLITLIMPPKDGILLDPFAGSGSTIIAAHQLGVKAIGMEKQAEYCEIARKRLEYYENIPKDQESQLDLLESCE